MLRITGVRETSVNRQEARGGLCPPVCICLALIAPLLSLPSYHRCFCLRVSRMSVSTSFSRSLLSGVCWTLPCWCLAVPQSKPSPPIIAQPCTSKSPPPPLPPPNLSLSWPQTGNKVLLASQPTCLFLLSNLDCWATQRLQGGLDPCLSFS